MKNIIAAALVTLTAVPASTFAWVDLGAYYFTPAPNSQVYHQPLYAYSSYGPARVSGGSSGSGSGYGNQGGYGYAPQYTSNNYPMQNNYGYGAQQYNYTPISYSHGYGGSSYQPYSYYAPTSYQPYGGYYGGGMNMYGQNVPYSYGYPTGDTVPLIGGPLCTFPDHPGRALCGSNPSQRIYDPWTGTWY